MLRRDFVRVAALFGLAPELLLGQQQTGGAPQLPPPAPVPWSLGLNARTPVTRTDGADTVTDGDPILFPAVQFATLTRLSGVLLPPYKDKPGAVEAETPLFLDFLIGNSPAPRKKTYTSGLDWLEITAQRRYKLAFAKLADEQVDALIRPWLRTWMNDHPPTETHADFVNIAHDDIRRATIKSKAWSDVPTTPTEQRTASGLYWSPIDPDVRAIGVTCAVRPAPVVGAPKSSHPTPSFPR